MKRSEYIMLAISMLLVIAAFGFYRPYRSRYYDSSVFDSPDLPGSGKGMKESILRKLDAIADDLGYPPEISRGFRTPEYNAKIGGVSGSYHTEHLAVDIDTVPSNHQQVLALAEKHKLHGIGNYTGHVHIDMGKPNRRWSGISK